ncbi:MAG: ATP-binding cassette domain-containing protein [Anaerolineales bacterium]
MINEQPRDVILETKNLSKYFGGLRAVDNVSLKITQGGLKSIIGPNGAGKTTLLNLLSGVYEPTSGDIFYHEEKIPLCLPIVEHILVLVGPTRLPIFFLPLLS